LSNVGSTGALILIIRVVSFAHSPPVGVNVYSVVAVLSIAGDHDPVTPFKEVVGSEGIASPLQYGPTGSNAGIVG
jgi:hypothetical protein